MTTTVEPPGPAEPAGPAEPTAPTPIHRRRWALIVAGAVGVVVALLIVLLASSPSTSNETVTSPVVGKVAPNIVAKQTDGRQFTLRDYRGGWVLVNFFANWCAPCKAEQPQLISWANEHEGSDFIVSVSFNDEPKAVKKFFEQNGGSWPVIAQGNADIALDYGVVKLPESYLVDPSGVVRAKFNGGVTAAGVDAVIARSEGTR